jgi:CRP-like cAMP-binding protein
MARFKVGAAVISAGVHGSVEGSNSPHMFTAQCGMGLRYKLLENARRVLKFIFPGDFIGLQAAVMGETQHAVEATSAIPNVPSTTSGFPRSRNIFWGKC